MTSNQLRPLPALLACGLLAAASGALAQEGAAAPQGQLTWHDCPYAVPGEAMRCGTLVVPEDHARPEGRTIALPVAVLPATSGTAEPDPILFLNGGPGASAMGWLGVIAGLGAPRASRDLVVIEQRGNGAAEPALVCGEDEEVRACHDRLTAEGIDLAQYTNANSARDVEALRRALGGARVNLFGISYGTTLALHVLRLFPEGVRSVVLDSASAPDSDIALADVTSQLDGLARLFAACAADEACARRFPDLRVSFLATVERLDAAPLPIRSEALSGLIGPELDGGRLVQLAVNALQTGALMPRVPALLDALGRGEEDRVLPLLDGAIPEAPQGFPPEQGTALGLTLSIYCGELPYSRFGEVAPEGAEDWPPAVVAALTPDYWTRCTEGDWPVPAVDPATLARVESDVPALVLAGEFDPITPLAEARRAAAGLTRAIVVEVPAATHGTTERDRCAQGLMAAFLADPESPLDLACAQAGRRLVFELGHD